MSQWPKRYAKLCYPKKHAHTNFGIPTSIIYRLLNRLVALRKASAITICLSLWGHKKIVGWSYWWPNKLPTGGFVQILIVKLILTANWYSTDLEYQIDTANKQITCGILSTKCILPTNKLPMLSWVPNIYCQQTNYLCYLEYQIYTANKQIICGILSTK